MEHGGTNDNVISVGSPKHDKFFQHYQKKASAVLIVVSELYHSNFDGTNIRAIEELDEYVKQLFILIKKLSKKEIILKLRPGQSSYEIQSIVSKLGYKIPIYKTQDIFDVMQMCDTVISMNFSTVVLDAMILKKPTMTILPEKQDYEQDIIMKSGATIIVNKLDELESKLNDILNNEELRQKLVEDGQKIVNKYFVNHGKASVALVKLVSSLL
jgi:CDP-glycerol glycerophosphotransferase (TagB/SpsB family)